MKPEPGDFQELQALLASRRSIQPPTRYLDRFSERVKERIERPEPVGPLTWRERLGLDADWKPAIMCAWGVALCSSLLIGIIVSLNLFQQHSPMGSPVSLIPGAESPFGSNSTRVQVPAAAVNGSSIDPVFTSSEAPGSATATGPAK